ncbi:hypothetical protein AMS59_04780 [Lysinibacillus sp. FJAT-14745]|uniref:hypothetical protein n=1 Tax=Lysinibacillus sp. FJAT-14745 TaxID=1704289 RepID=UPI0006AB85BD|nr:hypothetical protein [Lysinibacillus sp. FJAT-14745]KOP80691.1 hypothetical protein AMS59_04780 [Lysinibacillus sp. FJAT-14745]
MKLFHGTSLSKAKKIHNEMRLRGSGVPKNYENISKFEYKGKEIDSNTTDGYVYLGNFIWGLEFGNIAACSEKNEDFVVFEIDVPDELLEADLDQIKHVRDYWQEEIDAADENNITAAESFEFCQCVRVKGDMLLNDYKTKYAVVKSTYHSGNKTAKLLFLKWSDDPGDIKVIQDFKELLEWKSVSLSTF